MRPQRLSDAAGRLAGSPMFKTLARVKELEARGQRITHFEIGDPDFPTPPHIVEAGIAALRGGDTHYPTSSGIAELRDAVAWAHQREFGFRPDRSQVVVAPAISFIYFITRCVVNTGEEVIVPDPGFASYYSAFDFIGAKWINVPALEKNEFRLSPEDIAARITERTRLVIINSPNNPTGAVMTKEEIMAVGKLCLERGIYLLTDETYSQMIYDAPHHSPSVLDQCRERIVVLNSFSKSYAMTGWRLGWGIGPSELMEKIGLLIQTVISAVPPFIQRAGIAALTGDQGCIRDMVAEYRRRRDVMVQGLSQLPGVRCCKPEGAFYVFPNVAGTGMTSAEFTEFALEQAGVALLSGTTFGSHGEGYVRLCYANSLENCRQGLRRLGVALRERAV